MIAEPDEYGHVDAIAPCPFLIAAGELLQLPPFPRLAYLAAAVVGDVTAKHQAEWLADLPSGTCETARLARDRFRPAHGMHGVQRRHMAQQVRVGLAFRRAVRREPLDRDEAGMDVVGKQEGRIDGWNGGAGARGRKRRRETAQAYHERAPRNAGRNPLPHATAPTLHGRECAARRGSRKPRATP
ncbi:hypothetical protein D9M72_429740 [compost metagenome]